MEDCFVFKDFFCNDFQSGFFVVYDGYLGSMVVEKCVCYLGEIFEEKVERIYNISMKYKNVDVEILVVFNDVYEEMDKILLYGVEE